MKKIVAIDDEEMVLTCLNSALSSQGYDITTTTNQDEGLDMLINDKDVGLAMLDIRMAYKDGFQIYRELRAVRKLPVLFVTAYPKSFSADSADIVKMWEEEFADGTTDIIYKPFNLDVLYEKVESLIGECEEGGDD